MNAFRQAYKCQSCIHLIFLLVLIVLIMVPTNGYCQMMVGDPSLTLHNTGVAKIEIGGGKTSKLKLKLDQTVINVNSVQNATVSIPGSSDEISSEQFMMKVSASIGRVGDIFGTIGQARINNPLDGDYGHLIGLGIKLSPPQASPIKVGIILQAYSYSSEENNFAASFYGNGKTADGSNAWVWANGSGNEKITMTHYDAVIGFGVNSSSFARPYAGLLFSMIDGVDELTFSGAGSVNVSPATGGAVINYPGPVSFSAKSNIHSESSIGGFAGVTLNPTEQMGVTIEGQFGIANSYFFSAFMRF